MYEFGNILGRAVTGGGGDLPSAMALAVDRGSNRLVGAGYAYDVLGNLVEMPSGASGVFMSYLDQGHFGTLTDAAGVVWKYYYDADGKRRIKSKTVNGVSSITDNCSYYFYEGEDLICQQDIGALVQDESQYEPKFLLLDHLGSTRAELVFDPVSLAPQIQEYYDLMPYGEVIDPPSTQESVLFTGKQRDRETKLDLFGARVYSNSCFKWLSPDQPLLDNWISNPSSWNLYSYVRNNPLLLVDTTGKISVVFFDQSTRPDDKGKSGTSYGAKVFVVTSTNIYGPYRGSSYPNSNSRMINNTFYNTVKEGVYTFINRYGHKKGTQQGLNLVEFNSNNQQKRETPATTPDGMDTMATVINVHSGATDYGTERSRGSQGCLTIHPQDASSFFSNFSWFDGLGPIFSKGNDSGFLYLYRSDLDMTDQLNALQEIQMIEQEMSRYEQENK